MINIRRISDKYSFLFQNVSWQNKEPFTCEKKMKGPLFCL